MAPVSAVEDEFSVITESFEGVLRELHDDPLRHHVLFGLGHRAHVESICPCEESLELRYDEIQQRRCCPPR